MRIIYDIFFILFSLVYLPVLFFKGKAHKDFAQRFGFLPKEMANDGRDTLWVHTVSVGEVLAAKEFVPELSRNYPHARIVVSVTTRTGHEAALKTFGKTAGVFYFPLDIHFITDKVLSFIRPKAVMILETEIWPNFIMSLKAKNVAVMLVNGRISDRSFKGYRRIKPLLKGILAKIDLFIMQSKHDGERIIALGAPCDRVKIKGTMKYDSLDMNIPSLAEKTMRDKFGITDGTPVIIGGSTHKGEETVILKAVRNLREQYPNLRLVIAPRHIERSSEIGDEAKALGFTCVRASKAGQKADSIKGEPVIILDTIGELRKMYALATIVFVGGSLIKKGGQNIAEPAVFRKPVVMGPHTSNFKEMAYSFTLRNAAIVVHNEAELTNIFKMLLGDNNKREDMGNAGYAIVQENRGAVGRVIEEIKKVIG